MAITKKETIAKLKALGIELDSKGVKILGIDMKALNDAIASTDEVDFEAKIVPPTGHLLISEEELEGVKSAAKTEGKTGAERSVPEILAKLYKDEYGIKLDTKDPKEVLKAIVLSESEKAVNAAKLTVDEQVKLKDADIATLRNNILEAQKESGIYKTQVDEYKKQLESVNEMQEFSQLISGKYNPIFKPNELRSRFLEEEGFDVKKVDGFWVSVDAKGEPIKDKLLRNVPAVEKINEVLGKRKEWAKPTDSGAGAGGAAGGHGTGSSGGDGGAGAGGGSKKYQNLSQLKEAKIAEKWDGRRYKQEYDKAVSENPEFNKVL